MVSCHLFLTDKSLVRCSIDLRGREKWNRHPKSQSLDKEDVEDHISCLLLCHGKIKKQKQRIKIMLSEVFRKQYVKRFGKY